MNFCCFAEVAPADLKHLELTPVYSQDFLVRPTLTSARIHRMSALSRSSALLKARGTAQTFSLQSQYGRAAAYRRLSTIQQTTLRQTPRSQQDAIQPFLRSQLQSTSFRTPTISSRSLHTSPSLLAKVGKPPGGSAAAEAPEPPKPDPEEAARQAREAAEQATKSQSQGSESAGSEQQAGSKAEGEGRAEGEGEGEQTGDKEKKKKDAPPPPPHGDKSPWQVFTDTLRTEFKASKEWNESTKQLSGDIQDFKESEAVRRAREGYGAVSSTTGKVLSGTGKVIGQGAAWTWDSMPVKGVRAGVNATGRGIEKATRPVRETETYKFVANVIDDGSSSRYGGWVDKEQRRKLREAREAKEIAEGRRPSKVEKMEEDPE